MKLVSFAHPSSPSDTPRLGLLLEGERILDLKLASERASISASRPASGKTTPRWLQSMMGYLEGGREAFEMVSEVHRQSDPTDEHSVFPISAVKLLAPVPRPASIRDAMAFERHVIQGRRGAVRLKVPALAHLDEKLELLFGKSLIGTPSAYHELPVYYKGNPATVIGPEDEVHWPSFTERLDYELEVGFFINRQGRDLDAASALEHIGGYTIFNDFSARDIQIREMGGSLGPAKGKDFDTGNAMGPYLVTPDEIPDITALIAKARVNGEVWTDSSTAAPKFSVGELLSHISSCETLYPGDFIGLGTVPNGCGLEHGRWLRPGDVVELEVTGLGCLRNRIVRP